MIQLRFTHVRLLVDDVAACYRFYRDVLGFEPVFDGEASVYCEFKTGDVTLSLFRRKLMDDAVGAAHAAARDGDRVLLAFEVADVDKAAAELERRGVVIVSPPTDHPHWMLRVAHFRDPAGNLLEINQSIRGT